MKNIILKSFLKNARFFNRVNLVVEENKALFFDKDGNFVNGGEELLKYLERLEKKASEIESKPDYTPLAEVN